MEYRPLGDTDEMVPEIGLGTWRYQGDPAVLEKSLALGSNLIDTAENYGTEAHVGKAVRGNRQAYFLATKVEPEHLRHQDVLKAAAGSLKLLQTDVIDLYQVHWPNPRIPITETMRAMQQLLAEGKVRYVGVSNFSVEELAAAQKALGQHKVVSNQVLYNIFQRGIEKDLLPYCQREHVTIMAYSPLAQGRLDGELTRRPKLAQMLDGICADTGKTRAQMLLAWCIYQPMVIAIPQTNRLERVEENCGASGWKLTARQYKALSDAAA